jgi:hypothetical protein
MIRSSPRLGELEQSLGYKSINDPQTFAKYSRDEPLVVLGIHCVSMYGNFGEELVEEAQESWISSAERLLQEC